MSETPAGFEAIFRHCLAITSSLELDEVVSTTVTSLEELMPSASVTLTIAAAEGHGTSTLARSDGEAVIVPLAIRGEAIGMLQVVPIEARLSAADRTRIAAMVPTIASAVRNALFLARQRVSWDNQRALDSQKSRFIRLAASGLDGPLQEVSELAVELKLAGGDSMRATASDLLARTRYLADNVEEILKLSLTESSQIVLPED